MKIYVVEKLDYSGCYYEGDYPQSIIRVFRNKKDAEKYADKILEIVIEAELE